MRCSINIIMLNLVCMSISKLYNNCIINPQQLRTACLLVSYILIV